MVDCIIQARLGSTRLPGKVMMKVDSKKTVLESMLNQLRYSKLVDVTGSFLEPTHCLVVVTTRIREYFSVSGFDEPFLDSKTLAR